MATKKKTATSKFADQYKHPKWQKKRLEILERDDFTCRLCGDKESTLHVHHTRYKKGSKVWEYEDYDLITLCDGCHELIHKRMKYISERGIPQVMQSSSTSIDRNLILLRVIVLLAELPDDDNFIRHLGRMSMGRMETHMENK